MTDPDVALCLTMVDRLNADDIEGILASCHEDVVAEPILARVEGGAFVGHDGMRRWFAERDAAWETIRVEPTGDVRREGSHLLMDATFRSHARESGVDIEAQAVLAAEVAGGKVTWWGVYSTEADALARIREHDAQA